MQVGNYDYNDLAGAHHYVDLNDSVVTENELQHTQSFKCRHSHFNTTTQRKIRKSFYDMKNVLNIGTNNEDV